MFRISLVNMPFADLPLPSIALTQLKSTLESIFDKQIAVEILYFNHDFAKYLGTELYTYLANSMESLDSGLGDWFFRGIAFPELPDNSDEYFNRYFPRHNPGKRRIMEQITEKKPGIDQLLQELISKHDLDQAQLVGFTSMFMQNTASFAMARKLKIRNSALITIMGGANCEFPMGGVIAQRVKGIDYVFSGPALKSLPEFVRCCLMGNMSNVAQIPGLFAREVPLPSGSRVIGEELSIDVPVELDYEPFISRLQEYFDNEIKPILTLETSRGCWWGERAHCTFCGLNGATMAYRAMKPELAIKLFNSMFRYFGKVEQIQVVDNILPKNYLREVLPFLNTPSNMHIFYEVKADLSEQDVAVLARARVKSVQPGIEALATSTLKLMKKGTTAFQNLKLLKSCAIHGVVPSWNLLVGFPGETEEVYKKYIAVIPLLTHLCPPSGAYPVRFDRFSPYFDEAGKYQLSLRPLDFYSLIYPFNEEDLENLAYYFKDQNTEDATAEYFLQMVQWIDELRAKVVEWRGLWKIEATRPRLFLHDDNVVFDSRSGAILEYGISEMGKALLRQLERPTRFTDLSKMFSSDIDVAGEIAELQKRGLLFHEDDRLFSLVLDLTHESGGALHASSATSLPTTVGVVAGAE